MPSFILTDFLVAEPKTAKPEKYYSLLRGEDLLQVHSHGINLVLGRDIRRSTGYSCVMATELAGKGQRVLYLNSYAGEHLLRESFVSAGGSAEASQNVTILNLPTGTWDIKEIEPAAEKHDVLILNSFEFASMTRAIRDRIAREILDIQEKTAITCIVFSHTLKSDIEEGRVGRGPVGMLAAMSQSVCRLGDEWSRPQLPVTSAEPAAEKAIAQYDHKIARVHENRTLNKNLLPKRFGGGRPDSSVPIERDAGFSYHYGDYWCNPFDRGPDVSYLGKDMAIFARTPLLQKYLLDHPDTIFRRANTPTEAQLLHGDWRG